MKKIGLIVSLLAAGGSGLSGHLYFRRLEAEVSGGPKVPVLAAAKDVPVGAPLTEELLVVRDLPQAYVEGRHVRASDVKKVLGARVASGLRVNEALLWTDLAKWNEHARVLSGLVQNGMRAATIDSRSADFNGLLRPGDRVDVLLTTGRDGQDGATATLMQNILVLSVGGNIARVDDDASKATTGRAVSLSVNAIQAQALTLAQQRGRLTLTLRNPDDIAVIEGVPETRAKDLEAARDWSEKPEALAVKKESIEHVR